MFRGFVADCKARLQDRPANIVGIIFAVLTIMFFNVWGIITCGYIYSVEEEPDIYQLLPETGEERKRRLIFNAGMEMLLIAVLIMVNLIIMQGYSQSVLLQLPNLFLLDAAYCIYLFYHRICKLSQTQNKVWGEKQGSNSVYEGIVFIADKILLIIFIFCGIDLFNQTGKIAAFVEQNFYTVFMAGLGIGFVILLVDVIRQTGGRKYED